MKQEQTTTDYETSVFGDDKTVSVSKQKLAMVRAVLQNVQESLGRVVDILQSEDDLSESLSSLEQVSRSLDSVGAALGGETKESVVEGVFDGERMIGQDGTVYEVPANYASKSKLIEGDILKLTLTKNGGYIFKQIGPVERSRVVGTLAIDQSSGSYYVMAEDRAYKVIAASVTYYKGEVGDEVILLVPRDGTSAWAAIENIIKR